MQRTAKWGLLGLAASVLAGCMPPQGGGTQGGDAAAGGAGGMLTTLLPLVLIFVVFYFLLIRPQQKKQRVHREMLGNIRRGDQVVTGGGIIGNVMRVERDGNLQVEIAPGVRVRVVRATVTDVIQRPTPIGEEDEEPEAEEPEAEEAEKGEGTAAQPSGGPDEKKS
jgi:preprotein translocase subunit YajC